jgi:putative flavoprotein involved in K+ transport
MSEAVETVVVGAGQAGLAVSDHLARRGREHLVLERGRIGERWRSARWNSFTLVTPTWTVRLPDVTPPGDPDGFLTRDEVVDLLETYAREVDPPLRSGVEVTRVHAGAGERRYRVETSEGPVDADAVVVAVGTFQAPRRPPGADDVSDAVTRLHSSEYREPGALPDGGVLVVGSGQSGTQIADELNRAGRAVHLAVGRAPRLPRRYRGADMFVWADRVGMFRRPVDKLDDPRERFAPNPHVSGRDGGRDINLHRLARDGVRLLGRFAGAEGTRVRFEDDLHDSLSRIDAGVEQLLSDIDAFIDQQGLDAPAAEASGTLRDGYDVDPPTELDLEEEGISSVVWATGYAFDFGFVDAAILDDVGYPVQRRGVTDVPGLYFVGLHWLHTLASGLLYGVAADAEHVADALDRELSARA